MLRAMRSLPVSIGLALALVGSVSTPASAASLPPAEELRSWIEQMKQTPKGPFQAIKWFCKDGSVQPPKAYACKDHGGSGIQHGLYTDRVDRMRAGGYEIATLFADLAASDFVGRGAELERLKQILIERFLIQADDGWVFRGARSYRGAFQIEDEEAGAARVLAAIAADPSWRGAERFLLLREVVRLFPAKADATTASVVRQLAVVIADKDANFSKLRAKIHNVPDAGDAASVREYAKARGKSGLAGEYEEIAKSIDKLYAAQGASDALSALAATTTDTAAAGKLRSAANELRLAKGTSERFGIASRLLRELRDRIEKSSSGAAVLGLARGSLVLETEAFVNGSALLEGLDPSDRRQRLRWLHDTASALYGVGFLSSRLAGDLEASIARLREDGSLNVDRYRKELRYLARAPEWASRWLAFHFSLSEARLAEIEPLAHLFVQDRLRGSPLLFYGAVIDSLVLDANQLAGIEHELFGKRVGAGLRALNPGLSRGVLREGGDAFERDGIYLLPETVSELPRISGILTMGEGSSLSHVQLLARNLGVPNVVVGEELLASVRGHLSQPTVLAVSPNGVVQLSRDGSRWDAVFGASAAAGGELVIRPDLEKLDLEHTAFQPLSSLRATDSGRSSGPKGANLGELKHHFGDTVPPGFVIPFAAFRKVLDQPIEAGGPSVFEWMKERYATIAAQDANPKQQEQTVVKFLARLRHWIETCDPGPAFRKQLHTALEANLGPDGSFGAFVRSDTNVEDLPGFTGAGLNLTLFNIVGEKNILEAVRRVWASPFEDRSYGWRQENMQQPEYVFPAVVVQYSFPAEKSGVMVTADVDSGDLNVLTVAVNEGVGGAVDGQAAESLMIDRRTGEVKFLAMATAPLRTLLPATGGVSKAPASGTDAVLQPGEIQQLIDMSKTVESFPTLRDEAGKLLPADVEFAFKDGKLALLQIRPFVESKSAQRNLYLSGLDAGFGERGAGRVDLSGTPRGRTR
jgi:hypothetical protein